MGARASCRIHSPTAATSAAPTPAASATRRRFPGRTVWIAGTETTVVGDVPPLGVAMASSACSTSLAACGRSAGRLARQRHHERREHGGNDGAEAVHRLGHLEDVRRKRGLGRAAKEGRAPGEHLVGHHAERIDVRAVVDVGVAGGLLGRHVRRSAERQPSDVSAGVLRVGRGATALATPKSVTTATPPESSTLSGLMSRCTTPCACA